MGSKVTGIEYEFASKSIDNNFFKTQFPEYNFERFEKKVGIKNRFICDENENIITLALKSCRKLFKNSSIDKTNIEFLILCTQSPEYYIPSNSCILQDKLGLKNCVGSFDFNLGCSGYVYGLSIAKGLIESGQVKNVLLVTSETYSKYINKKDLINQLIFSDASTATLIEKSNSKDINNFIFGTDGSGFDKLIVKNNFFNKEINPEYQCYAKINYYNDNNLYMDGPSIFNFTTQNIPKLLEDILKKNNLKKEDVDYYIPHQANKFLLNSIRKLANIDEHRFIIDLENYGNTVSGTIPISLKNVSLKSKKSKKSKKIVLCGFGVGLSWSACSIKINSSL
tara:strand:- start:4888 stop:5901 length:1014 start_codon:yes stop_codon:yes gene_type:complete